MRWRGPSLLGWAILLAITGASVAAGWWLSEEAAEWWRETQAEIHAAEAAGGEP